MDQHLVQLEQNWTFLILMKWILYAQRARTASERDFSASSYTVWHKRNALLSRKVNMLMVLQQFWLAENKENIK